jgi:hypothetical protein
LARPKRVTEAELEEVLNAEPVIVGDPDDPNFKELVGAAGRELTRRFNDDPGSLPGTFVIKLFLDGMKALAAGAVPEAEDPGSVDILSSLGSLPPEHARELLCNEIHRLGELVAEYRGALAELEGK